MAKTNGKFIASSSNISQTNDDINYYNECNCGKRKLDEEKVTILKRSKSVRKLIEVCEIDCNDDTDDCYYDIGGEPTHSLTASDNEPKDNVDLGNRKVFVFKEDENAVKRNKSEVGNKSDMYIELTPMPINTIHNEGEASKYSQIHTSTAVKTNMTPIGIPGPPGKVGIPKVGQPNLPTNDTAISLNNTIISMNNTAIPTNNTAISAIPMNNPTIAMNNSVIPMNNVLLIPGISMEGLPIMVPIVMPQIGIPGVSSVPIVIPPNSMQSVPVVTSNSMQSVPVVTSNSMQSVPIAPLNSMPSLPALRPKSMQTLPAIHLIKQNVQSSIEAPSNIVISDVVSLTKAIENTAFNKFFEWRERTTDRRMGPKFDDDFNIFALNLHTINSRAYRLLMDSWQLPKENTLKDVKLKVRPKFDDQLTKLLGQKFKSLSNEGKYCTLGLYTVELKPHLYYDPANDEVIGVHNVNGVTGKLAANHALIAMVRGLKVPWHQLVTYSFLSTMRDVDSIDQFLTRILATLRRIGLIIKAVVMSDNPCFWKYCRSKHYISPAKVYLQINKENFFTVFDIPHILNKFKDDFMNNDFIYDNKTVSWKYVKQVYDLDRERGGILLSNLNEKQFQPGSKDRKTCQVFSGPVSKAMQFYIDEGLVEKEATATVDFIKKLNEIFDVVSAGKLTKMPSDALKSIDVQMKARANMLFKALDTGHLLFKKLKVASEPNKELDSVKYLMVSMKALYLISLSLKDSLRIGLLEAKRTSLEPIQNFLKSLENEVKTNRVTPITFAKAFSKKFVKDLVELKPPPKSIDNMDNFLKMADGLKDCYDEYDGNRICVKTTDYRFKLPNEYAIIYVSSYLTYKCSEKHNCKEFEDFLKGLVDLNKTKIYAHFKKFNNDAAFYNRLKLPAMSFVSYIERLDNLFTETFDDVYNTNPAETIFDLLKSVPKWDYPCPCFPKSYLLKLFVRIRIYHTVVGNTRSWKNRSANQLSLEVKKL